MSAEPWTPNDIDKNEALIPKEDMGPVENVGWHSMRRAFATIRALQAEVGDMRNIAKFNQSAATALGDKVEQMYSERDLNDAWAEGHNDGADSMIEYQKAEIDRLQAEIRELKTPSGYWSQDGDPLCYDDGVTFDGSPVESFEELERWATQCLFDDGERIVARPYRAMPELTYIVRWVPDADDPDMRRVKLERVG